MNRNLAAQRCLCTLAFLASASAAHAGDTLSHSTVATVNGQTISRAVLEELVKSNVGVPNPYDEETPQEAAERNKALAEADRRKMLDDLIVMEVLAQKARERGLHLRADIAAEAELQHKTLLGQHLVRELIGEIRVEPDEIAARYAAQKPEQLYRLSHILLKDEAGAKAAIAEIEQGADFGQVARRRSLDRHAGKDGGLGWLMRNQMDEPFAAAAGALKAGEFTRQPVGTAAGWHVIRLHAVRDARKPSLEDMRAILRSEILHEKVRERVRRLMQEARIELARP